MSEEYIQEEKLKKSLKRIYDNIEIPDNIESWTRVQTHLQKRKRWKRWNRRLRYIVAVFIGSLVLSYAMNMNVPDAYSFSTLFKNIQETMIEFFHEWTKHDETNAKTAPPLEGRAEAGSGLQMIEVTLEEAKAKVSFPIQLPTVLPENFELSRVRIFDSDRGQYDNMQIEYTNPDGEIINIVQRHIKGKTDGLKAEMPMDAGEFKDVIINGILAVLLIPIEGNINLEWYTLERVLIRISGNVSEDEILILANSLN